ncbi:unnamed protein product [Adineta ricciae]|uniref:Lipase domain-containing protein n=1 Tax=Adineta ricciae TaxID=249248 RepID=A0A814BBJ1_ADIRI|nr:unnamed protein product [Adineta ricciae]
MCSKAGLYSVLIVLCVIFVDAHLVSIQQTSDEPLAIDTISHVVPPMNRAMKSFARANASVCYPVIGCFDNNDPYNNAALEIPQAPELIDTHFLLFTQEAPTDPEFLSYDGNDQSIAGSKLNPSRWLRIIVHGFVNNRNSIWIRPMVDELLKLKNDELSDVLVVDWGNGAKFPSYPNAASNTRLVGKQIGLLLKKLHSMKGFAYDKIHCIGHSLGAHTCGIASNTVDNQLARISGLDPAGPYFEGKNALVRLDPTDAKFVDVLHTNTEIAFGLGLGSGEVSGHVDFYVNGGQNQPGCPSMTTLIGGLLGGQSEATFEQSSCSHSRAHGYFTESINSECSYKAYPCSNYNSFMSGECLVCPESGCGQMGFHSISSPGRGNMYLTTKSVSPFCGYHYLIEVTLDHNIAKTSGEIFVAIHSNYEMLANVSVTSKSNADIKAGDVFRHMFSYKADLGQVDYAIVYFNKAKSLFGWGGPKADEIVVSNLRLKSVEDPIVYTGLCGAKTKVAAYTSETILLNRDDCRH